MINKRIAFFVFFDRDGIVDRYVIYLLEEILKVVNRLIIICNGKLSSEGLEVFNKLSDDVIIRENKGFDAWGFRFGFNYLGWNNLSYYDELILINSTVYGPFYSLNIIFEEMNNKKIDFWGITKHCEILDPYGLTSNGIFPEHIQTYFISINKKMFSSEEFKSYWNNLSVLNTIEEAISYYEVQFTKYFFNLGYIWDVYINIDKNNLKNLNFDSLYFMPFELIINKMPFLKIKNFSLDYSILLNNSIGNSTKKAFDYIENYTEYNIEFIWENILRNYDLYYIKNILHLNYILPKNILNNKNINLLNNKISLFIHLYYEDQIEILLYYANFFIENSDIYITTTSLKMKEIIYSRFKNINCKMLNIIVLQQNRGRDVSALWVVLKQYMTNYDYICFIHCKHSSQNKNFLIGKNFLYRCLENILASKEYIINIINTFNQNPRLGLLFPPPVNHGPYQDIFLNLWTSNYDKTIDLLKKLNVKLQINNMYPIFPAGGMFWFRPKSLMKIIDQDWKYEDFPDEPLPIDGTLNHAFERIYCYVAQSEGYYSGWVMTDSFASTELTTLNHLIYKKQNELNYIKENISFKDYFKCKIKNYPKLFNLVKKIYLLLKH